MTEQTKLGATCVFCSNEATRMLKGDLVCLLHAHDAPGGERAKDEPNYAKRANAERVGCFQCGHPIGYHAGNDGPCSVKDCKCDDYYTIAGMYRGEAAASPRPAEPEPPKAEQAPSDLQAALIWSMVQEAERRLEDCDECYVDPEPQNVCEDCSDWQLRRDTLKAIHAKLSQPKAEQEPMCRCGHARSLHCPTTHCAGHCAGRGAMTGAACACIAFVAPQPKAEQCDGPASQLTGKPCLLPRGHDGFHCSEPVDAKVEQKACIRCSPPGYIIQEGGFWTCCDRCSPSNPVPQPKADTGTLETVEARIENALAWPYCGGALIESLLRDALTELQRLKHAKPYARVETCKHCEGRGALCPHCYGRGEALAEARASSPDLRALVASWRAAAEDRGDDMGVAYAVCASQLEASLTGTGEQK